MGFLNKKADPFSDRSKALNAQIASLEAQIKKLDQKLKQGPPPAEPLAPPSKPASQPVRSRGPRPVHEPLFEALDERSLDPAASNGSKADHYNELGVRKYDLVGAWSRLRSHWRGPPASNPKLVSYLAAGSIKGLRPLRYEKRVARNRFIAVFLVLVVLLWGIIAVVRSY